MTSTDGKGNQRHPSLDELRRELDACDDDLFRALAKRRALVAAIRKEKRVAGKPIFDREREREVRNKARSRGDRFELPGQLVQTLMDALLADSHQAQSESSQDDPVDQPRHLVIVGGNGRMGRLYARVFSGRGHQISTIEQGDSLNDASLAAADAVIVAVPMDRAEAVTAAVVKCAPAKALVCDINSLKLGVCDVLKQRKGGATLGTHPMFGPTVGSFRRQKIVICPIHEGEGADWFVRELGQLGADLIVATPEQHDRAMSVVQVLTHFGIMVMGQALRDCGMPLADTLKMMSPIYRLELTMVARLFSQDPALYYRIVTSNPFADETMKRFRDRAATLAEVVSKGDEQAFRKDFEGTRQYLDTFAEEAMQVSDDLIAYLVGRA